MTALSVKRSLPSELQQTALIGRPCSRSISGAESVSSRTIIWPDLRPAASNVFACGWNARDLTSHPASYFAVGFEASPLRPVSGIFHDVISPPVVPTKRSNGSYGAHPRHVTSSHGAFTRG